MTFGREQFERFGTFHVIVRDETPDVWLDLEGEVDVSVAPRLREAVIDALSRSPRTVYLSMNLVSFIDSSGIAALLQANERAKAQSSRLVIHSPSRAARRALTLIGLSEHLTLEG